MDKVVEVLLALLALIHLTNCQGVAYNYTDDCIKITTEISVKIQTNGRGVVDIYGKDFSSENPVIFCEKDSSAELNIVWMKDLYSLTLYLTRNSKTWEVSSIQFEYTATNNSDFTTAIDGDTVETNDTEITNIDMGNSYRCKSGNSYALTGKYSTVNLTLANLQLQAFKFINHAEFGKAQDCHSNPPHPPHPSNQSVVIDDTFGHCIRVNITVEDISITYRDNKSNNVTVIEPIIKNYTLNYFCDDVGNSRSAEFIISWPKPNFYYNLSISFSANYKRGKQGWEIGDMTFQYNTIGNPDFKIAPDEEAANLSYSTDFTDDSISLTRSYKCDKNENYTFTSKVSNSSVTLSVSFIQLQAFQFANSKTLAFGSAVECDQGATPVIVPILVGSALGLFVIILLLAYVIGRLRQRRAKSGYHRL